MKQFKLSDFEFYHLEKKSLPPTILSLLEQGYGVRQIARKTGKTHPTILYYLKKLEKQGDVVHIGKNWLVNYPEINSGTVVVEKKGWGVPSGPDRGLWEAHKIEGLAFYRRVGNWERVKVYCEPSSKKGNWVLRRGDVTLVLRKRSVQVVVHGLQGDGAGVVFRRALNKALPVLRLVEREFGFKFGSLEWRAGLHWTLDKQVSSGLLRVAPQLADSSHPDRVELHFDEEKRALDELLTGLLKERVNTLINRVEALELVVREQAVVLNKLVEYLEKRG